MSRRRAWPARRRLAGQLIGVVCMAWLALSPTTAHAHALLSASEPEDGASVDRAPAQVLMTFTEAPDPALSIVHVLDGSGQPVEAGKAEAIAGQPQQLRIGLRPLASGTYTVSWRTTSAVDGHTTAGSFAFGVGVPAVAAGEGGRAASTRSPAPTPASVAGRWLLYSGLALLVGGAMVGLLVARRPEAIPRLALAGSWAVAAAGLALVAADQRASARTTFGRLLRSSAGHKLTVEALAVLLTGAAIACWSWRRSRPALGAVGATAAIAMLARAGAGHAAASSAPWFTVAAQWLHLVAVGVWVGGLAWLLVALRGEDPSLRGRLARRFSALAAVSLAVVALSGAVRAVDEVGAWRRLFDTGFGRALIVKVALFAGMVAIGALNRFRNVPRAAGGRVGGLRAVVGAELVVAAGVLGATAVLAGLPPSASVAAAAKPKPELPLSVTGNDYRTSVRVNLTMTPGTAGPNRFEAAVVDYDSGQPIAADTVTLRFQLAERPDVGPSTLALSRDPDGRWQGQGSQLSIDGRWDVTALVETNGDAVVVPMAVVPKRPPQRIDVTRTPGLPDIYTITLSPSRKVQTYVDPGKPGFNEVHMTFTDGQQELALDSGRIDAVDPAGGRRTLVVRRLGPGHFVGDADLTAGVWRFELEADAHDGSHLTAQVNSVVR